MVPIRIMLTNLLKQTCHCVDPLPCRFNKAEETLVALCKPKFTSHISSDSLLHNIFAILAKDIMRVRVMMIASAHTTSSWLGSNVRCL